MGAGGKGPPDGCFGVDYLSQFCHSDKPKTGYFPASRSKCHKMKNPAVAGFFGVLLVPMIGIELTTFALRMQLHIFFNHIVTCYILNIVTILSQ